MTQEMYGASGKIGNKTYYRSNGKTVARDQGSFIDLENEYYLNNAGEGGAQGSSTPAAPESNDPTYNNTVSLNGVSQGVGGGSVSVTAPFATFDNQTHKQNVNFSICVTDFLKLSNSLRSLRVIRPRCCCC